MNSNIKRWIASHLQLFMSKGSDTSEHYESMQQLKSYFKKQIEAQRNYTSPLAKRMAERKVRAAQKKGLNEQQEQSFLNALERNTTEVLDKNGSLIMCNDCEPQGFLRHVCEEAGLSIGEFMWYVGLPSQLRIVISPSSLSIYVDGRLINLSKA